MFPGLEDRLFWYLVRTARRMCRPVQLVDGRQLPPPFHSADPRLHWYLRGLKWGYQLRQFEVM